MFCASLVAYHETLDASESLGFKPLYSCTRPAVDLTLLWSRVLSNGFSSAYVHDLLLYRRRCFHARNLTSIMQEYLPRLAVLLFTMV